MKKISTLLGLFAAFLMQFFSSNAQAITPDTIQHELPNATIFHDDGSSDEDSDDDASSDDDSSDDEVPAPAPPPPPTAGGGF